MKNTIIAESIEYRTNSFDGGSYWVCNRCHKPLPNGTVFKEELWKDGNIFCSRTCRFLHALFGRKE